MNGPDWINHDEMVRRTIESPTGQPPPRDTFVNEFRYHMNFKPDKKGPIEDVIPGTLSMPTEEEKKDKFSILITDIIIFFMK